MVNIFEVSGLQFYFILPFKVKNNSYFNHNILAAKIALYSKIFRTKIKYKI